MNDGVQQQAGGIDQDMPLLAFDFLPRIIAMRIDAGPPFSALFHALAVDDGGGRTGLPFGPFAAFDVERVMDVIQRPVVAPAIEIVVNSCYGAEGLSGCRAIGSPDPEYTSGHSRSRGC